jgi:Txe/YoeB family toxin of Txe-Axe toxin-antitoxin module
MNRYPVNISLTEALTWLAFGKRLDRNGYINAISSMKFNEEHKLLSGALEKLLNEALTDSIEIYGKYCKTNGSVSCVARKINMLELASYQAFDLTIDGLWHGTGLQWLPDENSVWTYKPLQTSAHFQNVTVKFTSLKHHLNRGRKPLDGTAKVKKLDPSQYETWFERLSKEQKDTSEKVLVENCQQNHPEYRIVREEIRKLRRAQGPLKRGPKTHNR